jgi:predicted Zn finger-like uncharacterized protein
MQIQCPHCGSLITADSSLAGSRVTCPKCGKDSRISGQPQGIPGPSHKSHTPESAPPPPASGEHIARARQSVVLKQRAENGLVLALASLVFYPLPFILQLGEGTGLLVFGLGVLVACIGMYITPLPRKESPVARRSGVAVAAIATSLLSMVVALALIALVVICWYCQMAPKIRPPGAFENQLF